MARLIDADALYIKLGKLAREPDYQHEDEIWSVGVAMAMGEVWEAPTIDAVEVVHGRWQIDRGYVWSILKCSSCNHWFQVPNTDTDSQDYSYCPSCGAKMDLEVKDG